MKGGKEVEGKGKEPMEPMFPRLHVNDREKGGPRAPPRNKMALYEQLAVPSKRSKSNPSSSALTCSPAPSSVIQANGYERMVLSPFVPPKPHANSEDMVHSRPLDTEICKSKGVEFGRSFEVHASNNTVNARGSARKSIENAEDDDDGFRVPTIVNSETASFTKHDLPVTQPKHVERSQERCYRLPTSNDKHFKENYEQNRSEENCKQTSAFVCSQEITAPRKFSEPSNRSKTSSTQDHTGTHRVDKELHLESSGDDYLSGSRCSKHVDVVEEKDDSQNKVRSCSKASFGKKFDKFDRETQAKSNELLQLGDEDINEVSGDLMVDSVDLLISPDDVVGVIGMNHFWKARRAIVNQQRVFAIQVFELHRLIKVQKLISAFPDVIKTDLDRTAPLKTVPTDSQPEDIPEAPPPQQNDSSENPNQSTVCPEENLVEDQQISKIEPHVVGANAFTFHPPPNQWLVPVMSPSEGLIYKPYVGPCPPLNGFVAPFYGGFMNSAYQRTNYFPSFYSLPMANPMFSSSSVEQASGSHPRKLEAFTEVRGSTVSDRSVGGVRTSNSCCGEDGNRVTKVVPRNAGSARESAARILMSIQVERLQSNK